MSKYQAIAYVRLSYTDDRSSESDSISNQKLLIEDFVKHNPDIEIVSVKVDDGFSGVLFDRPAFLEMMDEIKAGRANCILVKDLSRLGREYIETGRYLRRIFPAYDVRFIAINDNVDTLKDECDELNVTLRNVLNDAYCHDISKKTRCALASKRQKGDYVGACTVYGYQKSVENKNQLEIDEVAAATVKEIFRLKIDGASAAQIATELNRRSILSPIAYKKWHGLPHPKGGFADKESAKWSATTVIRILKDEIYTGILVQGKQGTYNHKVKALLQKPVSEWIRTEHAHSAIIEPHNFDLVQRIMHLDTRTSPGGKQVHLFSGILLCGCCGGRMTRKTNTYKGEKYIYYYCPTGKKNDCANPTMLKEDDLIECVLASLKAHINNVASLDSVINGSSEQKIAHALVTQYTRQIAENELKIQKKWDLKSGLYEDFVSHIITNDDYKLLRNRFDASIKELKASNQLLKDELERAQNNTSERLRWVEHFKRFSTMTELDRRAVVQLIEFIKIERKDALQISYRYALEFESAMAMLQEQINVKEAV